MSDVETFVPIGERVLVKRTKVMAVGGIELPESYEGKQVKYEVLAVNPNCEDMAAGDIVIAVPDGAQKITLRGHGKCEIMETRRILGVYEHA